MPLPDVLNRYQALTDRDSMARAIATLQARGEWNEDRSLKPEDYPPLTADEHLELIALGEVMARHYRHPALVHHAVVAGATWDADRRRGRRRRRTRRGRRTGSGPKGSTGCAATSPAGPSAWATRSTPPRSRRPTPGHRTVRRDRPRALGGSRAAPQRELV